MGRKRIGEGLVIVEFNSLLNIGDQLESELYVLNELLEYIPICGDSSVGKGGGDCIVGCTCVLEESRLGDCVLDGST